MNFAFDMASGTPVIKKFRVASGSTSNAGGYVTGAVDGGSGVVLGLTTSVVETVGVTLDAATGSTTPTSDTTPITATIINPLAVYRLLIVKGATGGQVDILTESVGGSKTANTITTGETAPNSPDMNEGAIFCISGVNKGSERKCTSTSATVATITEGWVTANAIGDVFMLFPQWKGSSIAAGSAGGGNINLTTNLANARADIASGTGAKLQVVEFQIDYANTTAARNRSFVLAQFSDTIWTTLAT